MALFPLRADFPLERLPLRADLPLNADLPLRADFPLRADLPLSRLAAQSRLPSQDRLAAQGADFPLRADLPLSRLAAQRRLASQRRHATHGGLHVQGLSSIPEGSSPAESRCAPVRSPCEPPSTLFLGQLNCHASVAIASPPASHVVNGIHFVVCAAIRLPTIYPSPPDGIAQ
jgi:hypothetical protein